MLHKGMGAQSVEAPVGHRGGPRKATDQIRLNVAGDVRYWAGLWGLTDHELREAVADAGPVAADVAAHLGQPGNLSPPDLPTIGGA